MAVFQFLRIFISVIYSMCFVLPSVRYLSNVVQSLLSFLFFSWSSRLPHCVLFPCSIFFPKISSFFQWTRLLKANGMFFDLSITFLCADIKILFCPYNFVLFSYLVICCYSRCCRWYIICKSFLSFSRDFFHIYPFW